MRVTTSWRDTADSGKNVDGNRAQTRCPLRNFRSRTHTRPSSRMPSFTAVCRADCRGNAQTFTTNCKPPVINREPSNHCARGTQQSCHAINSHTITDSVWFIKQPQQPNDVVLTTHSQQLSGWAARQSQRDATVAPPWPSRCNRSPAAPVADRPAGRNWRLKTTKARRRRPVGLTFSRDGDTRWLGGSGVRATLRGKCRKVETARCGSQAGINK